MTDKSQDTFSQEEATELLNALLHKEGNWVDWGKTCQKLQKAGYHPQDIFEQTGFQGSQQNLVMVAAQVYESLLKEEVAEDILNYFLGPHVDILYEFRILNQVQRGGAAQLAYQKKIDVDEAKEVARAIQEFSRMPQLPSSFTNHPGDAIAYQYWKRAKQKKDFQDRARLIAKGLKFCYSQEARDAIEKLLSDFSVTPTKSAPLMAVHRLEQEEELARIVPLAGTFPLTRKEIEKVTALTLEDPFRSVQISGTISVVPLPGWQAILKAIDPIAIVTESDQLPKPLPGKTETVLVIVDRAVTQWNSESYFLIEEQDELSFQWFAEDPNFSLLGQVILVLRPKKILDENNLLEPWQMDD